MQRYVSFSPYYSGLSNVIMSYELFLSIAHVTKRTAILPPRAWCLFLSPTDNKHDYVDMWTIFDKSTVEQEFDTVDFDKVKEIENIKDLIESPQSYTGNIKKYLPNLRSIDFPHIPGNTDICIMDHTHTVLTSGVPNTEDFKQFSENRPIVDLNTNEQFLHFENNLFGHFWYHVYPGDAHARVLLKNKVNRALRYQNRFYDLAKKVSNAIGPYNAVHVRRSDFLAPREREVKSVSTPELLATAIKKLFPTDRPLYIATDETDMSFFEYVRKDYKIFFYRDFNFDLNLTDHTVLEQVICSQADLFHGTYLSTYSKRINVMRGLDKRPAYDYMGINRIEFQDEMPFPLPWIYNNNKRYYWNDSSCYQWNMEV